MKEEEEECEPSVEERLLHQLRQMRKGTGLTLVSLGGARLVVEALAAAEGLSELVLSEGMQRLRQEVESLGQTQEARAVRNALAIGREQNPENLTTRRNDFAAACKRHVDTVEIWENRGFDELAKRLSGFLLAGGKTVREAIAAPIFVADEIPAVVSRYLRIFPEFSIPRELSSQYVRTSRESFMGAARLIFDSLGSDDRVFGTDAISFDREHIVYWSSDGVAYLRINYEAALRGVRIERVFVVSRRDLGSYGDILAELCALQAASGVNPKVVCLEELPSSCRYEFALFGASLVDEVVYDMSGHTIVDNFIHWSDHKLGIFRERANLIENYVDHDWAFPSVAADSFDDVVALARNFGKNVRKLRT